MTPTPRNRPGTLLLAILLAAACAAAGRAEAYVIYLKDGSRIVTKEKPVVQGTNYVFLSTSGNRQMIPISEVDQKRTDAHSEGGFGDSYVMSDVPSQRPAEGTAGGQSLSDVIRQKRIQIRDSNIPGRNPVADEIVPVRPTPVPAPAKATAQAASAAQSAPAAGAQAGLAKPAGTAGTAGTVPANPNIDPQVNDAFTRALETAGVKRTQLVPAGGVLRIQAVTDSEQQVFAALGAVARGLKESRALGKSVEKAELVLATSSAENAGRFTMTAEDADALLNGKISAAKYFVANVVF